MWRDGGQAAVRATPRLRWLQLVLSIVMILGGAVTFVWRMLAKSDVTPLSRTISLKVIAKETRLRDKPATDATVVGRVGQGDVINVDAVTAQGWCRVQTAQGAVWVFCGLLEGHTVLPFEPVSVGGKRKCRRKSDGILVSP